MTRDEQLKAVMAFAKEKTKGFDGGHDWQHIIRVRKLALLINEKEKMADPFTVELAALLHDAADSKFTGPDAPDEIRVLLSNLGLDNISDHILFVIEAVSFSKRKNFKTPEDPVLMIVQDADMLDAIGAIGIARAFNYGGFRNRPLWDPAEEGKSGGLSTIAHFHDKLLKLKDLMNTSAGRLLAEERHAFLLTFLEQFKKELDF
jgi:uncharacterized protein